MKPYLHLTIKSTAIRYPIFIGEKILNYIPFSSQYFRVVIVTDHTVKKIYALSYAKFIKKIIPHTSLISFSAGESSKVAATKIKIEKHLFRINAQRDTLIIALGGGVVGDIAGFVAATYLRGISYLQIPTTLMAMVDSSIGGKTAINTEFGKNSLGCIWHPQAVLVDINFLQSLSHSHILNGLAEILKIFITHDVKSFNYFKKNILPLRQLEKIPLLNVLKRAINLKADIVSQDPTEKHLRATLNFGHTIGHAIEKVTGYKMLHGFAVALGMLVEAKIAVLLHDLDPAVFEVLEECLIKMDMPRPSFNSVTLKKIFLATFNDKKTRSNRPRYVLLKNIGEIMMKKQQWVFEVPDASVKIALSQVLGQ